MARMAAEGGAHRHLHRQAAEQRRIGAGLDRRQVPGSRPAVPRKARPPASPSPLRHNRQLCSSSQASCSAAVTWASHQMRRCRHRLARRSLPAAPGWRRSRPPQAKPRQWFGHSRLRGLTRAHSIALRDAGKARIGPRPAQAPAVQLARMGAETRRILPSAAKGCLSSASSGTGAKAASAASASRHRKAPARYGRGAGRRNRRSRCPSASVPPPPAAPGCGRASPARRCGPGVSSVSRSASAMTSASCAGSVGGDQRDAFQSRRDLAAAAFAPTRARHRWWARGAASRAAASRAPDWCRRRASPATLSRSHPMPFQQLLQAELRMAGIELAPAFCVQPAIQPRQHHRALGQARDHAEQSAVAGIEPVEPAAITMPCGGWAASRAASCASAALRRAGGIERVFGRQNRRPLRRGSRPESR